MFRRNAIVFVGSVLLLTALGLTPNNAQANLGQCAQPFTAGGDPSASDCLYILQTAVGNRTCDNPCICAPKGTLPVRATDALICLARSVNPGQAVNCPCASLRGAAFAFTPNPDVGDVNIRPKYTATDYVGAFAQGDAMTAAAGDWTAGWTIELHGNHTVWHPSSAGTLNGAVPTATGTCPTGTTLLGNTALPNGFAGHMDICQLPAQFNVANAMPLAARTLTLTNDNIYRYGGGASQGTKIGNGDAAGATPASVNNNFLVIEPGTLLLGGAQEALMISRGSQITVNGTAANPVMMGSQTWFTNWLGGSNGTSGAQEWGGLVLMGFATINIPGGEGIAEGFLNPERYGGGAAPVDSDSSGSVNYLVIANAGFDLDGNGSELNGMTFYGVGYGTTVDHVQIHRNFDDNFEFFGGKVVALHLVGTDGNDDNIDTDNGFQGGIQFAVIKQKDGLGDKGFESDNDATGSTNNPRTQPTVVNLTHLGTDGSAGTVSGYEHTGWHIRRRSGYFIWNNITQKNDVACIRLQDVLGPNAGVLTNPDDGTLQVHNTVAFCPTATQGVYATTGADPVGDETTWFTAAGANDSTSDPTLNSFGYPGDPDNN